MSMMTAWKTAGRRRQEKPDGRPVRTGCLGRSQPIKACLIFRRSWPVWGSRLSTSKIKKILITGGCWSTERSRQIGSLYAEYTGSEEAGGMGLGGEEAVRRIADELKVSRVTVSVNLPYQDVVYNLEHRSKNAERCSRYRKRRQL